MKKFYYLFLISLVIIQHDCKNGDVPGQRIVLSGSTMGTYYSIKIVQSNLVESGKSAEEIQSGIKKVLAEVNQQMSTYIDSSEISKFNQYQNRDWFPISHEFAEVLFTSLKISKLSSGTFDITVGPLVNLWGFGPEKRESKIPTDKEIFDRKSVTGYQKLSVRRSPPAVKKEIPGIYCDLSGIAKGFGVDMVAQYLKSVGISRFLVDIGGEICTSGKSHTNQAWKIGISTADDNFDIQKVIPLYNKCIATSGDYRNYFEQDGIRYSHTIDPLTGKPITHKLASVTVVHDSCIIADGLATAIDVMGPEQGLTFANQKELAVFMIVREQDGFAEKMTPKFEKILKQNNSGK
jgi:thiamine biosynthesis lipoprotein